MNRRHLFALCMALTAVGLLTFAYKVLVMDFPVLPDEVTELWRADLKVRFRGTGKPVKVDLHIPKTTERFALVDQTFVSPGYGWTTVPSETNRRVLFTTRKEDGERAVYYRAVIHKTSETEEPRQEPEPARVPSRFKETQADAARAVADALQKESADTESFATLLLARLRTPRENDELAFLAGEKPTRQRTVRVAVEILLIAGIPARAVHGLPLESLRRDAQFVHWLEVYTDGAWRPFDPADGKQAAPANAIPWWRGNAPLVKVDGATDVAVEAGTSRALEVALSAALSRSRELHSGLIEYSVLSLPIQVRAVYQVLLAIPVGIMVLVILRNVVGLKTFGTFMPVLIAMAFRETELIWGVILFTVVCSLGLMVRFYLERLKLLLVPRLAAVVITVIIIMAILSVLSHKLGFDRGLSVALFPIVILAMTIERMSIVWDEAGPKEALQQAAGSMTVAVICYLVMSMAIIQHLFFVFPELLLVVLAATLMLGRYSGYRLVELPRFKVLAGGR